MKIEDEIKDQYADKARVLWASLRDTDFHNGRNRIAQCLRENATELENVREQLGRAVAVKNGAYAERNKMVAALSKLFPSWLEDHPATDTAWESDWRTIVFINLPTGQASWHLHDSEVPAFSHLSRLCGNSWDGHTTEQKYERLGALVTPAVKPSEGA